LGKIVTLQIDERGAGVEIDLETGTTWAQKMIYTPPQKWNPTGA